MNPIYKNNQIPPKRGYYSEIVTGTLECPVNPALHLLPTVPRRSKLVWQIFTEQHGAVIKNLIPTKSKYFLGAAERWMTFPEDKSIVNIVFHLMIV
ncbi:hypothetical protein HZH68_003906 [Vespula germanica]|uniref:Uncharacterized protein n=1 Tax=Vespula germanica TaxID=30212 RepID=A0A834KMR1_VESGE|nr:hypothetical protein HZH68_003906 [Vespula germanica]